MDLPYASAWLKKLLRELRRRKLGNFYGVKLKHDKVCDQRNQKSPRAFCHVVIGKPEIHCSKAIEYLDSNFIVGILLHELIHMVVTEGDDPELDVDEFVIEHLRDTGYTYMDTKYFDPFLGKRKAKSIECVKLSFLETISE